MIELKIYHFTLYTNVHGNTLPINSLLKCNCSLFVVRCSLFVVRKKVDGWWLFVVRCSKKSW